MTGNGVPAAVQTRQRPERLRFPEMAKPLAAAGTVESRVVRAHGYNAVVGLCTADVAGSVLILGAPEINDGGRRAPGTFVLLATVATAADSESGLQAALVNEQVRADYVKVRFVNGAAAQGEVAELSAYLVSVYGFKEVVTTASPSGGLPNRTSFETNQQDVAVPGTAEQLQDQAIPDGFSVFVSAKSDNTDNIFLGSSKAKAENHAASDILAPGQFRRLYITNANLVWVDAAVADEGVTWIVET